MLLLIAGIGNDKVLPIYIGDDRTDEDAFKFLREKNIGYEILVSSTTKERMAAFSLRDSSKGGDCEQP
jgi:trehalose 6-phosphate phosphatase